MHMGLINPSGAPAVLGKLRFIMDTGSGHHLVSEKYVRGAGALGKYSPWPNLLFSTLLVDPVVHWGI